MGSWLEMVFGNSAHYVQDYFPKTINAKYLYEYQVKNGQFFNIFFFFINSALGFTICHIRFLDIALFPHPLNRLGYQSSAGKRALISFLLNREGAKAEK